MTKMYFHGSINAPSNKITELPKHNPVQLNDPSLYQASPKLASAVNVALTLGMPLLLTGEPGSGKTELAERIAWELGFPEVGPNQQRVFKFSVKSTTEARDLFYTYDAVGRFQAAQMLQLEKDPQVIAKKKVSLHPAMYIHYQALGLAILRAKGFNSPDVRAILPGHLKEWIPDSPQRSIVLIDEIDKAPRDVPNDILNEIVDYSFAVPELKGTRISLNSGDSTEQLRPIVIITSNDERDLPSAFLRRCVFYHVPFPPFKKDLAEHQNGTVEQGITIEDIVLGRIGTPFSDWPPIQDEILSFCRYLRRSELIIKKPSLAEILNCLMVLSKFSVNQAGIVKTGMWQPNTPYSQKVCSTLLKNKDDQQQFFALVKNWQEAKTKGF